MMRQYLIALSIFLLLPLDGLISQSVGINNDGSAPHSSAILDIKSDDKGILIPRLTSTEIGNIATPATGLIVYDETLLQFMYYNGTAWKNLSGSSPLEVESNALRLIDGTNTTDLLYGRDDVPENGQIITDDLLLFDNSKSALRFGRISNSPNWSPDSIGQNSFAMGFNPKAKGGGSMAVGNSTITSGSYTFAAGSFTEAPSAYEAVMGRYNTKYTPVGASFWSSGDRLFVLGNGTSNSNRKDAFTVLKNGNTTIAGTLTLTDGADSFTFPNSDGSANQVLKTDGVGNMSWTTDAVNDADADNTNELQSLSLIGSNLAISSANSVNLFGVGGHWTPAGQGIYYPVGSVGIGTATTPAEKLAIRQASGEDAVNITNIYSGTANKRGLSIDLSGSGTGGKTGMFATVVASSSSNSTGVGSYVVAGSSGNHRAVYGSVSGAGIGLEGIALDANGIALKTDGPSHLVGNVAIGSTDELGALHVHNPSSSLVELFITPNNTNSGGSSSLFLAEDDDATYAMEFKFNGTANNLELFGHAVSSGLPVVNGPHLLVSRDDGNVAIGGEFAAGYKLSVDGKVACEEVLVELSGSWPDYVFQEDYNLKSIDELEQYINTQKHLPGIAPAKQIETEGLKLGEMQKSLTEKIEELTLYIIELNNSNKRLQARIQVLENKK